MMMQHTAPLQTDGTTIGRAAGFTTDGRTGRYFQMRRESAAFCATASGGVDGPFREI